MPSRLLQLRIWLGRNRLLPTGRLALITCYLFGIDLLLFVVQKTSELLHRSFGAFLGTWVIFLSLAILVLLSVLIVRRIAGRLLWRLRNRLIVTYIFIGVVPLLLLAALAIGASYLCAGQFAIYVATSRLDNHVAELRADTQTLAKTLAANLETGNRLSMPANL